MTRKLYCLAAAVCLLASSLFGQDASGRVIGTVTDPSGAAVVGAKVTVTNADTKIARETASGPDGSFQVLSLPIGKYMVSAEAPGFRKAVTLPASLRINESLRLDVKLEVGATTDTVQVEADISGVETVISQLGGSVTASQIVAAPLNGRNVLDLALLQPGVVPSNVGGAGTFSVAGGRQDSVGYVLDGGVNTNLLNNGVVFNPNPDAVQEFRILTSNYSAEYGRSAGGVVTVATKSGTNEFHGSAYDYIRNKEFNANSFFNNAFGLPIDTLKRNQFGGSLGGPVLKDKLFFFGAYQGQRQSRLTSTSKVTVYTPAELAGDFSKSNNGKPDPGVADFLASFPYFQPNSVLAGQAIIDPSRINNVAANYIKAGLIPTHPSGALVSQGASSDNREEVTGKADYNITNSDRLAVTLGYQKADALTPFSYANVSGYPVTTSTKRYFGTVNYTKLLGATMINEFRFTVQRNNNLQNVPSASLPTPQQLGVGITSDDPHGPTNLYFNSGISAGFSVQGPTALIDNTYTWSDTFTWNKGSHGLKTGFFYTPYQNNTVYDFYVNGEFSFYGSDGVHSGNDRADFLFGLPDELLQFGAAPSNIRTHNLGFFVQDEWKVRRNLTLTFGLRYEYSSPKYDTQNRSFSLAYGQQSTMFTNAPKGLLFPGDAGAPRGANFPDKNDWAPRFGFAWDPKGNAKTSIRGGFGVFNDILKAEDNLQFNGQAPFYGFADLYFDPLDKNPTGTVPYFKDPFGSVGQPNPFPSRPPAKNLDFDAAGFLPFGGGGVYFVNPKLRTPYIYQYNLAVQHEVLPNVVTELAYVGSKSHKLTGLYDANPFALGTNTRLFNRQSGVPSYAFSYLDTFDNVGWADYNSLQTSVHNSRTVHTAVGDFSALQFSWTYGKSLDNVSGFRTSSSRVSYYNWNLWKGPSDFDLRHYFSFNAAWDLGFDKLWASGPKRLTRGWTVSPIMTFRTGQPLTVYSGISRSRTKVGPSGAGDPNVVHANLVAPITYYDPHTTHSLNETSGNFYFTPSSFSVAAFSAKGFDPVANPAQRTYGTLGRNAFRGPSRFNTNISIAKTTPLIGERLKLEIHADFFNIFNNAQFGDPSTSITSGTFGQISTTGDPRIIQLAARITF